MSSEITFKLSAKRVKKHECISGVFHVRQRFTWERPTYRRPCRASIRQGKRAGTKHEHKLETWGESARVASFAAICSDFECSFVHSRQSSISRRRRVTIDTATSRWKNDRRCFVRGTSQDNDPDRWVCEKLRSIIGRERKWGLLLSLCYVDAVLDSLCNARFEFVARSKPDCCKERQPWNIALCNVTKKLSTVNLLETK